MTPSPTRLSARMRTICCSVIAAASTASAVEVEIFPGAGVLVDPNEPAPVLRAVEDLRRDLERVFGETSPLVGAGEWPETGDSPVLVVAGPESDWPGLELSGDVQGRESHAVYVREVDGTPHIVLHGSDMRGTIYAIYTFSEEVLGVSPLWFWASRPPESRERIALSEAFHSHFDPPEVEWRAWFPNDQRRLSPWRQRSEENFRAYAETMMRLKLNVLELNALTAPGFNAPYEAASDALMAKEYGLAVSTSHQSPLGAWLGIGFNRWNNYWENIRNQSPPEATLANKDKLLEFWEYHIETVLENDLETVWMIGFRGKRDHAFWEAFPDAPDSDEDRGEVIRSMMDSQIELLETVTGRDDLPMRTLLYNEKTGLVADGHLELPERDNLTWNFVAARRDHFPAQDVLTQEIPPEQPIGYYMNFQFNSTGSHMVQAEGPWKMERNYRTVAGRSGIPLAYSVVNAGNIREHVLELDANARLLWDFDAYDSDVFLDRFCETYFGSEYADDAADLYRRLFEAHWRQREPDLPGFERQYIFQDLRLGRSIDILTGRLKASRNPSQDLDPFWSGDWFRIEPSFHGVETEVDALIAGLGESAVELEELTADADALLDALPERARPFFNDNLRVQAYFLRHATETVLHLGQALRARVDERNEDLVAHAVKADEAAEEMVSSLDGAQHGVFRSWYHPEGVFNFRTRRDAVREAREAVAPDDPDPGEEAGTDAFFDDLPAHAVLYETDFYGPDGWSFGSWTYIADGVLASTRNDNWAGSWLIFDQSNVLDAPLELSLGDDTTTVLYFRMRFGGDATDNRTVFRFQADGDGARPYAGVRIGATDGGSTLGISDNGNLFGDTEYQTGMSGLKTSTTDYRQYRLIVYTRSETDSLKLRFDQFDDDSGAWEQVETITIPDYRNLSRLGGSSMNRVSALFRTDGESVSDLALTQASAGPLPPRFGAWRGQFFSLEELRDNSISGPLADPDRDGIDNLLEFAAGGHPLVPASASAPVLVRSKDGKTFQFTRAKAAAEEITYLVDASSDLQQWESIWNSTDHPYPGGEDPIVIENVADTGNDSAGSRFMRLRVRLAN